MAPRDNDYLSRDDEGQRQQVIHLTDVASQADRLLRPQVHGLDQEAAEQQAQADVADGRLDGAKGWRRFEDKQHGSQEEDHASEQRQGDAGLSAAGAAE